MSSSQTSQRAATGTIVWTITRRLAMVVVLILAFILSAAITIYIIFRGGDTRLPNVIGKTEGEAKSILDQQKFDIRIQRRNDEKIPANTVIETRPTPDSSVKKNSVVTVVVSNGPVQIKSAADFPKAFQEARARHLYLPVANERTRGL
jgi:serine/threonine-protein kinase